MTKLSKSQQEVWDRLKNGIPPVWNGVGNPQFNAVGTMFIVKGVNGATTMYQMSRAFDITTATVWPPK